jgi:hypothetical protein
VRTCCPAIVVHYTCLLLCSTCSLPQPANTALAAYACRCLRSCCQAVVTHPARLLLAEALLTSSGRNTYYIMQHTAAAVLC